MWQQFVALPGFRGATGERLTTLVFPSPLRRHMSAEERAAELEAWWERALNPAFPAELEKLVSDAARRAAERLKLKSVDLELELDRVRASRWWRARTALAELRPVQALRARRRGAR